MRIVLIRGTTRPGNYTKYVVREIDKLVSQNYPELEVTQFAPDQYNIVEGNKEQPESEIWMELNKQVDGYIVVTPEYNHSAPGSLKMLLDEDFSNYNFKPVALVGVSNGPWGGTRAIESLLSTFKAVGMVTQKRDAHMPNVNQYFDENGEVIATKEMIETFEKEVLGMLEHFTLLATSLKKMRA